MVAYLYDDTSRHYAQFHGGYRNAPREFSIPKEATGTIQEGKKRVAAYFTLEDTKSWLSEN